jgi:GNAT superfamily N-acetyltransferase
VVIRKMHNKYEDHRYYLCPLFAPLWFTSFMEHVFQKYWRTTFANYQTEPGRFAIPEFRDPLMSPRFAFGPFVDGAYFNFIGDPEEIERVAEKLGFKRSRTFMLGTKTLEGWRPRALDAEVLPLKEAIERPEMWEILSDGFPAHVRLLKAMLGFLPNTRARYLTTFLNENPGGPPAGVVTVGVCEESALVLTAAIRSSSRGKKLGYDLVEAAAQSALALGAREAVFWTEHEFLLKFADEVTGYSIFQRAESK